MLDPVVAQATLKRGVNNANKKNVLLDLLSVLRV